MASRISFYPPRNNPEVEQHVTNKYKILSIDGGGIRGIIPAKMLVEIERITREPISSLFQLIGGTSTGGMLGLGLTKPHPDGSGRPHYRAQDLLDVYTNEHAAIFRENPDYNLADTSEFSWTDTINYKLHNTQYLAPVELFDAKFGDAKMEEALTGLLVTANETSAVTTKLFSLTAFFFGYDHDSLNKRVHYFTREGFNTLAYSLGSILHKLPVSRMISQGPVNMSLAAQMTSAAPTFFPPLNFNSRYFVDGGVLQNNPAITCVTHSLYQNVSRENLFLLSLGTGDAPNQGRASPVDLWFEMSQPDEKTENVVKDLLRDENYYRFQHHFPGDAPPLDAHDPETIQHLVDVGNELVENNSDQLRDVCRVLQPGCI